MQRDLNSRSSVHEFEGTRAKTLRITVDLVDKGDERRMKFVPAPTGDARDPGGLIAAWNDYQKTFWQLVQRGEVAYRRARKPIAALLAASAASTIPSSRPSRSVP